MIQKRNSHTLYIIGCFRLRVFFAGSPSSPITTENEESKWTWEITTEDEKHGLDTGEAKFAHQALYNGLASISRLLDEAQKAISQIVQSAETPKPLKAMADGS